MERMKEPFLYERSRLLFSIKKARGLLR